MDVCARRDEIPSRRSWDITSTRKGRNGQPKNIITRVTAINSVEAVNVKNAKLQCSLQSYIISVAAKKNICGTCMDDPPGTKPDLISRPPVR